MGRRLIRRSFRSRFGEHRGQVAVFEQIALFREGQQDRFACDSNPSSRVTRSGWHRRDVKDGVQGCPGQSTRYGPRWVQRWQRRHAGPCHDDGGPGRRRVRRFCTRSDRMVHWQESDAWRSGASGAGCCPSPQSGANEWNGIDRHSNSARRPNRESFLSCARRHHSRARSRRTVPAICCATMSEGSCSQTRSTVQPASRSS